MLPTCTEEVKVTTPLLTGKEDEAIKYEGLGGWAPKELDGRTREEASIGYIHQACTLNAVATVHPTQTLYAETHTYIPTQASSSFNHFYVAV